MKKTQAMSSKMMDLKNVKKAAVKGAVKGATKAIVKSAMKKK